MSFPQFSGSAPAPGPPGTRTAAEEETASALLPRSFRFLKKEMKFLLTNEKLRSSSSSAGKNGKAPRPVFLAKRYRLAWKLRRRFRPLASDYTIFSSPQGKKSSCHCRNPSQSDSASLKRRQIVVIAAVFAKAEGIATRA